MKVVLMILLATLAFKGPLNAQQKAAAKPTAKPPTAGSAKAPATTAPRVATRPKPQTASALTTQKQRLSYSIGLDLGDNFMKQEMDVDPALVAKGLRDKLSGGKLLLSEKEISECMSLFRTEMTAKQQAKLQAMGDKNRLEGDQFLAANQAKEGVVTLPSGLQYRELVAGTGPTPRGTDTVSTHYRGTLLDGTEFDSSYHRGEPASFPVSGVIPGWTEALQLMKVGSKWQLFVPSKLAYGDRNTGSNIGPNSLLIFEIELLGIK